MHEEAQLSAVKAAEAAQRSAALARMTAEERARELASEHLLTLLSPESFQRPLFPDPFTLTQCRELLEVSLLEPEPVSELVHEVAEDGVPTFKPNDTKALGEHVKIMNREAKAERKKRKEAAK